MRDVIGWVSSFVLVLTLGKQVYKQYRSGSSEGVSRWLFVGQLAASAGFTVYSVMLGSYVFVVTNGLMVLNALAGLAIWHHHQRRERASAAQGAAMPAAGARGASAA
jgi:uncharacterized protein with PQ loop repeat